MTSKPLCNFFCCLFCFLSAYILINSVMDWQNFNLILQQILVFLCISVSDSKCGLPQPSLTLWSNMFSLLPKTLILSKRPIITNSGAEKTGQAKWRVWCVGRDNAQEPGKLVISRNTAEQAAHASTPLLWDERSEQSHDEKRTEVLPLTATMGSQPEEKEKKSTGKLK